MPARAAAPLTTVAARSEAVGRSERPADRFMRKLLRVPESTARTMVSAHRAFRLALVISGIRCLVTYLVVPIVVPIVNVVSMVAAPIGILLCLIAVVSGIAGVRRFWASDHRAKWMYTWFMAAVFLVLGVALVADITRLVA
jgi:hypothetical protein